MRASALCFLLPAALLAATAADAAMPSAMPGRTVDNYTAAQSGRAEAAARDAGYDQPQITMVQDGNFFLTGDKAGQAYFLTVTGDGKVYPSRPATTTTG